MIKFVLKKFSTSLPKNISNLNSLNKFIIYKFETASTVDFIEFLNKFQELGVQDQNAKLKLYDVLDYILYDEKSLSDNSLLKTLMRTMLSVGLYDKVYWDHFKQVILKNNMLFNSDQNFLDYMKIFSIVSYEDEELWKIFEEYFLEMNRSFDIEEVQTIALCFGNNKKGSKQFWLSIFDIYDLKNQKYPDFILNFSICLCGFLQSKIISKIDERLIEYFCRYLNFSAEFLNKNIQQGTSVEKIDLVYSLFPHVHKSYYIDKIHQSFPNFVEKSILKSFVETLENFLKNYLDNNVNKLEDEDFEQISRILKYSFDNRISLGKLKSSLFVKIFVGDIGNIKNHTDIYNFLNYFNLHNIKEDKLKLVFSYETIWEVFIDHMHQMNLDQLISLTMICKNYNVKYFRVWIFIQNFFKLHIKNLLALSESKEDERKRREWIEKVEKLVQIFDEEKFKYEEFILLPFIVFLKSSKSKLILHESYRHNSLI